eukprot:scaffold10702_cov17-Tisochrysis_lutea.AAC.3
MKEEHGALAQGITGSRSPLALFLAYPYGEAPMVRPSTVMERKNNHKLRYLILMHAAFFDWLIPFFSLVGCRVLYGVALMPTTDSRCLNLG